MEALEGGDARGLIGRRWAPTPPAMESRRALLVELGVVVAITLGTAVLSAVLDLAGRLLGERGEGNPFVLVWPGHDGLAVALSCIYLLVRMGAVVALVAYVLHRAGESLRTVGVSLSQKGRDLALIIPFAVLSLVPQHWGFLLPHAGIATGFGRPTAPAVYAVTAVIRSLESGVLEEVVVLGFVLTRLRQLGVHPLVAVLISAVLRASYHVEYGWAAFGPLLFGVGLGLMYLTTRRLLPAIAVHVGYDIWVTFQGFRFV